jgi:Dolichyl-phosphate-mannose-protein mannosyltransferase
MTPYPLARIVAKAKGNAGTWVSVLLALAAGLALRLWMMGAFPQVSGDTLIYGNLAKNLLLHGQFAITDGSGVVHSTLIRLPGYPLFLALCFWLFGMDNYTAVACAQITLELAGCLLLADFVRRIASPQAALCTLWLSALCPFTASYAVAPLTETLTLFVMALALWALARFHERPQWPAALWFAFAVSYAALLRPDGALVGVALAPPMIMGLDRVAISRTRLVRMGGVGVLLALAPFAVWTARNWQVFHVFEPLAPRYATDPGESSNPGWQRWVKTWSLDFVSTYDIYWNVPGNAFDITKLPSRAFDSPRQYAETVELAKAYDENGQDISPELDAHFARLAEMRVEAQPLRFYLWLPFGRMADMWLRPRVENLPIDLDWWVFAHHNDETRFSWAYAALNALYLLLGLAGLCLRPKYSTPWTKTRPRGPRYWPWMVAYMVMRSLLLMTIEAPEARYTLECFPMLFALGGIGVWGAVRKIKGTGNSG